jgi:phage terminase small subunit
MPVLDNPRHELFAQSLAAGKSAAESYVAAGFKENRHNAATLARQQHILDRVAELLAEREAIHGQATADAVKAAGLTKAWVVETLMTNVARAMQAEEVKRPDGTGTGEYRYEGSVANRALELLGKELGMFVDRKQDIPPEPVTDEQLDARIRELAGRLATGDEAGTARTAGVEGAPAGSQSAGKVSAVPQTG